MRKKINLKRVGIRSTKNLFFTGRSVPYVVFGDEFHGIGHSVEDMPLFVKGEFTYKAFRNSAEWKALCPKIIILSVSAGLIEFCSHRIKKPEDILRELHKVFESPVLDAFIKTRVKVADAVSKGLTLHSTPKGKEEEQKQSTASETNAL